MMVDGFATSQVKVNAMFSRSQAEIFVGKTVKIVYRDSKGVQTERLVVVDIPKESHFVAWCTRANSWRSFRYDSVESVSYDCQQFSIPMPEFEE